MAITYLQEKEAVAAVLGKTDGATPNTIRDNAINEVRQFDIANAYPFSWLEKTSNTLTTDADGKVDLPSDFNVTHKPKDVREVVAGSSDDNIFTMVARETFDNYQAGDRRYYIDYNTVSDKWQIVSTEPSTGITVVYYQIPATLTDNTSKDIIPDLVVVKYLAAGRYWLLERNSGNFDRFNDLGIARLQFLINKDKKSKPRRLNRGSIYTCDLGFNTPD